MNGGETLASVPLQAGVATFTTHSPRRAQSKRLTSATPITRQPSPSL